MGVASEGSEKYSYLLDWRRGFPGGSEGKNSACSAGDPGLIPGLGRSPGKRILARRIPWIGEPSGLQPMEPQRVRHDRETNTHTHTRTHACTHRDWRRRPQCKASSPDGKIASVWLQYFWPVRKWALGSRKGSERKLPVLAQRVKERSSCSERGRLLLSSSYIFRLLPCVSGHSTAALAAAQQEPRGAQTLKQKHLRLSLPDLCSKDGGISPHCFLS